MNILRIGLVLLAVGCLACTSPPVSGPDDAPSVVFPDDPAAAGSSTDAPSSAASGVPSESGSSGAPEATPGDAASGASTGVAPGNDVSVSASTPPAPREVGPGFVRFSDGTPVPDPGKLSFLVFETEQGVGTIGCWPTFHPALATLFRKEPGVYSRASVSLQGVDFVRVDPVKPLDLELPPKPAKVERAAGLAYANADGALLLSLTDKPPAAGFFVVGQSIVDLNVIDRWREAKSKIHVKAAGGLKT